MARLIPLALLLLGCEGSPQNYWTAETSLTAAAIQASEDWCIATDGHYCPTIVAHGGLPITYATDTTNHNNDCGWITVSDYGRDIVARKISLHKSNIKSGLCEYNGQGVTGLLRHEFGHATGLLDVDDTSRVMHYNSAQPGVITTNDVADATEINGWECL